MFLSRKKMFHCVSQAIFLLQKHKGQKSLYTLSFQPLKKSYKFS